MEAVVLRALQAPPCVVAFSGGRDSSAVLALAVHVARREGLPLPVAASSVFPQAAQTDETAWQHNVLEHLGLARASRLELRHDIGALGPAAREVLARHGLLWPSNLHFAVPLLEQARGGSLLTGLGGDELGGIDAVMYGERVVTQRAYRSPRNLALVAYKRSPAVLKAAREFARGNRYLGEHPWLTRAGRIAARRRYAADFALPFGYAAMLDFYWRSRFLQVIRHNLSTIAAHYDATVHHPFNDPGTLSALAATGGIAGHGDRASILRRWLGDLLADDIIDRRSKAVFNDALWTPETEAFARRWSGRGLDPRFVDPGALRREWLSGRKGAIALTALQAAWLADEGQAAGSSSTSPRPAS